MPVDDKTLASYRREQLKRYISIINIGKENESFYVDFDHLVQFLMGIPGINFSAAMYERLLVKEIEDKVIGINTITPELMNRVADYVWDLAKYCTSEKSKNIAETEEAVKKRALERFKQKDPHKAVEFNRNNF